MDDINIKDKKIPNSVKAKKIKNFKFYDIENASSTFQKIITKYQAKKVLVKKQPKNILAFIEKAKFKAENLETENEYMMKELRRDIKLDQELVNLFGQRAKKHYNELNTKKFKSKINKFDFFTPKEIIKIEEEKKEMLNNSQVRTLPNLSHIIFKSKKISFSPTLMAKRGSRFFNTFNKDLNNNNFPSNTTRFKRFYNTSTNMKKYLNSQSNNKSFNINDNNIHIFENNKTFPNKTIKNEKFFRDKIGMISNNNLSLTNYNNNNMGFNTNKIDYLNTLAQIKRQFTNREKEFKTHFRNNDYGCKFSKMEYRYLTKKFFN